jgi:hypothetical protein
MEACMKKYLLLAVVAAVFGVSSVQAAGGFGPCLATIFLDPRLGLDMNEGKDIQTNDWLRLLPPLSLYAMYAEGYQTNGMKGCCVACIWGNRAGHDIDKYKLRSKEVLMCVPVVNIYPCIALPLEAYGGKTMSQVIQDESLAR